MIVLSRSKKAAGRPPARPGTARSRRSVGSVSALVVTRPVCPSWRGRGVVAISTTRWSGGRVRSCTRCSHSTMLKRQSTLVVVQQQRRNHPLAGHVGPADPPQCPSRATSDPPSLEGSRLIPPGRDLGPLAIPPGQGPAPSACVTGPAPVHRSTTRRLVPSRRPLGPSRAARRSGQSSHDRSRPRAAHRRRGAPRRRAAARRRRRRRRRGAARARTPALRSWGAAPAVLVGADQAAALAALGPPRRGQVHVLSLGSAARRAVPRRGRRRGAASVLELPAADDWLVELLTDVGDGGGAVGGDRSRVVGGSGGVGASVLAAALALTAGRAGPAHARSTSTRSGPGSARAGRRRRAAGVTWAELAESRGRLGARALRDALPGVRRRRRARLAPDGRRSQPPAPALVREVLVGRPARPRLGRARPAAERATRGSPASSAGATTSCWSSGPRSGGVAAAATVADRLRAETPARSRRGQVRGGVRRRPRTSPARSGCRCVAELPDQRRLDEHLDLGLGPVHRAALGRWPGRLRRSSTGWPSRGEPTSRTDSGRRGSAPDVVEEVRELIARDGAALTPAVVAAALRSKGRPVGDATVLAVLDVLRRDVVGAGPLEHLLRTEGVTDVLVNGPDAVYVDRGDGLELTEVRFPDDGAVRRLAQRLAAGAGPPARRRQPVRRPAARATAPGSTRCSRRWPGPARTISLRVPRRRVVHPRRAGGGRARCPRRARGCSGWSSSGGSPSWSAAAPARARRRSSTPCSPPSTRPTGWCSSRTPPSCGRTIPHVVGLEARPANVEGAGRGRPAHAGAAGAPDAPRPARRRRGARRRGRRPARRAQHRPRGRLRHGPRQLGRRRAGPARGARAGGRDAAGRGALPDGCRARGRRALRPRPGRTAAGGRDRGAACRAPTAGWRRSRPCRSPATGAVVERGGAAGAGRGGWQGR